MVRLADPRTRCSVADTGCSWTVQARGEGAGGARFWPTWPATGTHAAVFSLIGFTRAYAAWRNASREEDCDGPGGSKFNLVLLVVFVLGLGVTAYLSWTLLRRNAA